MTRLLEYALEDGGTVVVEVADEAPRDQTKGMRPTEVVARAGETFEAALERLRPMTEGLVRRLSDLAQRPDEMTVEFAITMTAEAGAVLARIGADANLRVSMTWNKPPDPGEGSPSASA